MDPRVRKYPLGIEYEQGRNKYHHGSNFSLEMTPTFNPKHYKGLERMETKRKYLAREIPMEAVNEFRLAIKNHVLDPETKLIKGTEKLYPPVPVYHFYNNKTKNNCMFKLDNETGVANFISGWTLNDYQQNNLNHTGNVYNETRPESKN